MLQHACAFATEMPKSEQSSVVLRLVAAEAGDGKLAGQPACHGVGGDVHTEGKWSLMAFGNGHCTVLTCAKAKMGISCW
jgi:hypothetical protein